MTKESQPSPDPPKPRPRLPRSFKELTPSNHLKPRSFFMEMIVKALVDQPDAVEITEIKGNHAHVIELSVAKEDLGKVIGKGGAHASAIRTILAAASGKENKRYILEIIEN